MPKEMYMEYSDFISLCSAKGLNVQYVNESTENYKSYYLFAYDGAEKYTTQAIESNADDFEQKYKSLSNKKIYPIETLTNWIKVRPRRLAGDLFVNFIYFTTSSTGSLDSGDNANFSISTNQSKTETYVDFCPNFDFEVGGGGVSITSEFETSTGYCKLAFIGAPDYPPEYGGSVKFIGNKKFTNNFRSYLLEDIDPKLMRYNSSVPGQNKLRLKITHEENAIIGFEYYLIISVNL